MKIGSNGETNYTFKEFSEKDMRPHDSIAIVTDSESEDDTKKKPFFKVPSPGKTVKRTKRGTLTTSLSTPPSPGTLTLQHTSTRRLSNEELINQMEKEQDAMVMRLLREIDSLREENVRLRRSLNQMSSGSLSGSSADLSPSPRTNSITGNSRPGSTSSASLNLMQNSSVSRRPSSSSQLLDNLTPELQRKRNSITKNDLEYLEDYSPTIRNGICTKNLSPGVEALPRKQSVGCGSRRRRSSGKAAENTESSVKSFSTFKLPKTSNSASNNTLTIAR